MQYIIIHKIVIVVAEISTEETYVTQLTIFTFRNTHRHTHSLNTYHQDGAMLLTCLLCLINVAVQWWRRHMDYVCPSDPIRIKESHKPWDYLVYFVYVSNNFITNANTYYTYMNNACIQNWIGTDQIPLQICHSVNTKLHVIKWYVKLWNVGHSTSIQPGPTHLGLKKF